MYLTDAAGNKRAFDNDWSNNRLAERLTTDTEKTPFALDSTSSGKEEIEPMIGLDYAKILKCIDELDNGTIYVLKYIDKRGYDSKSNKIHLCDDELNEFITKYGMNLQKISNELRNLGICHMSINEWGNSLCFYRISMDNIKECYTSLFYDSLKSVKERSASDIADMANSNFIIYRFRDIYNSKKIPGNDEYKHIPLGYIATFKKYSED